MQKKSTLAFHTIPLKTKTDFLQIFTTTHKYSNQNVWLMVVEEILHDDVNIITLHAVLGLTLNSSFQKMFLASVSTLLINVWRHFLSLGYQTSFS